jgi:hypothetical protein
MSDTTGALNFLSRSTEKPAFIVQPVGTPSIRKGEYEAVDVPINDGRQSDRPFDLDCHGFALIARPTSFSAFDNDDAIVEGYYAEIRALVASLLGPAEVHVIDHTTRTSETGARSRGVVTHVHNDYTRKSCLAHAERLTGNPDIERDARIVQLNIWRPLSDPVLVAPLAIADGSTIAPSDLVACDIVYPDRVGEIYELRHHPRQRWYYFPKMRSFEALVFKGYDSGDDISVRFTPHTSFSHPDTRPDDPPRRSIEVRTISFLPKERVQ